MNFEKFQTVLEAGKYSKMSGFGFRKRTLDFASF